MRCDEFEGLLAGLVVGDLSPAQEEFARLHLQGCPRCQAALAGLEATRRRLAALHDDYRPDLSGRINRAIARAHTAQQVGTWAGRALRAGGALAALALVLLAVLQGPALRQAADQPAPLYLVEGREVVAVDLLRGTTRSLGLVSGSGQLQPGGLVTDHLRSYALVDGKLREIPLEPEPVGPNSNTYWMPYPSRLLMRHNSFVWAVREAGPKAGIRGPAFALDRVDLDTGEVDRDEAWKAGQVLAATLSPDGDRAYLLTLLEETLFVKVVDTRTRSLLNAHRPTAGFGPLTQLLPSPDGTHLHLVDRQRWVTVDLQRGAITLDRQEPEMTAGAALNPAGTRLLSPRPEGGLALFDARSGEALRKTVGARYRRLLWKDGWIYAVREDGIDLINPATLHVHASHDRPVSGYVYIP